MPRKETRQLLYRTACMGFRYVWITNTNTRFAKFNKHKGRAYSHWFL